MSSAWDFLHHPQCMGISRHWCGAQCAPYYYWTVFGFHLFCECAFDISPTDGIRRITRRQCPNGVNVIRHHDHGVDGKRTPPHFPLECRAQLRNSLRVVEQMTPAENDHGKKICGPLCVITTVSHDQCYTMMSQCETLPRFSIQYTTSWSPTFTGMICSSWIRNSSVMR